MSSHLTTGQRALLESALLQRRDDLDRQLARRQDGLSRVEHARDVLEQDADDAPQRDADREIDLALSDMELQELGAVAAALKRLGGERYGLCADCDAEIPFDRLKLEPWTLRCVACEAKRERGAARHATL